MFLRQLSIPFVLFSEFIFVCAVAKYPDELMDAILTKGVQELEKNLDRVLKVSNAPEENR